MKTLFISLLIAMPWLAIGQAPIVRQWATTNGPTTASNVVKSISIPLTGGTMSGRITNGSIWVGAGAVKTIAESASGNTLSLDGDGGFAFNGTLQATAFTGSGDLLTTLNASALESGTVANARLPNPITNTFYGNGSGLTNLPNLSGTYIARNAGVGTNTTFSTNAAVGTGSTYWRLMSPDPKTGDQPFVAAGQAYSNGSTTRSNNVYRIGYNLSGASGEGSAALVFETHYGPDGAQPQFEVYIEISDTNGNIVRPFSSVVKKNGSGAADSAGTVAGKTVSITGYGGTPVIADFVDGGNIDFLRPLIATTTTVGANPSAYGSAGLTVASDGTYHHKGNICIVDTISTNTATVGYISGFGADMGDNRTGLAWALGSFGGDSFYASMGGTNIGFYGHLAMPMVFATQQTNRVVIGSAGNMTLLTGNFETPTATITNTDTALTIGPNSATKTNIISLAGGRAWMGYKNSDIWGAGRLVLQGDTSRGVALGTADTFGDSPVLYVSQASSPAIGLASSVGIGTTTPLAKLEVASGSILVSGGNADVSGSVTASTITVTNSPTFRTTNAAPANVTVGTTAPDTWIRFTNASGQTYKLPAWAEH